MRIGVVQTDPRLGDLEGNLGRCLELLDEAAAHDCELVVFPECAFSGYMLDSVDAVRAAAETIPGATTQRLAVACARLGVHCVAGMLELDGPWLRNTAVLVAPDGLVGGYRKSHIACIGADRFTTPGDDAYEVFETSVGRIGLQVCYDWRFPEITRVLALAGADIVINSTNSPVASRELADYLPRARAVENGVYFAFANRVGNERGVTFFGRSQVVDPVGRVLALAGEEREQLIVADVDVELAREKTKEPGEGQYAVRLWADRRPELYGGLAESAAAEPR